MAFQPLKHISASHLLGWDLNISFIDSWNNLGWKGCWRSPGPLQLAAQRELLQGWQQRIINPSEPKQTVNPTGDPIDHGSKWHFWHWRDTKTVLKKIYQERMTIGSQISGNSTFHPYTNQNVKCNKPMIPRVIPPPGLSAAKCIIIIIITVCDCHPLLPSQGLLHKIISAYFLYRDYCLHQELSTSLRPRMRHLYGFLQRAQKGLKLVDSIKHHFAITVE